MPFLLSDLDESAAIAGYRGAEHVEAGPSWHSHVTGQLAWSALGPTRVHTPSGVWIAPVNGAVWVPPGCPHDLVADFARCLYFEPALCEQLPSRSCIVAMTPTLRAAAESTLEAIAARRSTAAHFGELRPLLVDAGLKPLQDPFPQSAAASPFVHLARREPGVQRSAREWAQHSNMTAAALTRDVVRATGMTCRRWQRQVRLLHGLHLLAEGRTVRDTSLRAGYTSASHWLTAFKASLGTTPARYFAPLPRPTAARDASARRTTTTTASAARVRGSATVAARGVPPASVLLEALLVELPPGAHNRAHRHDYGELTWPTGAQSVSTATGTWVGHSDLALWVPAGCEHETQIWGRLRAYVLHPGAARHLPERPCVVRVTPPLRRALLELLPTGESRSWQPATETLLAHARDAGITPLPLPLLRPERLAPLVEALRHDPSLDLTLEDWARRLGVGRRTVPRLFENELGISFGQLRRLMQTRRAVELLALGGSVASAARAVGYAHIPKFIAMFRRTVGSTPGAYFRAAKLESMRARER